MKVNVMCRKFECRKDIHYKTQTGTSSAKCRNIDAPGLVFPYILHNISNNSFSIRLREDQSREMNEMRQDIADIKQILTQTFLSQALSLPPAKTVPTVLEAQLSRSTSSGKTQSRKSRKRRDKVSSKEQLDRSQEIVSMTTTPLPGVDVRREQPQMATPGQDMETKNSTC